MNHLRPVKSLGQSFLTYEPAADRLVEALNPVPGDEVIEIGPGKGVLTRRLVGRCRRVTAIEVSWGQVFTPKMVRDAMRANGPFKVVGIVHAETSTGVCTPLEDLSKILVTLTSRRHIALILEDLQWITKPDLELLCFAVRSASEYPVLLLLTLRSGAGDSAEQFATFAFLGLLRLWVVS